MKCGHCAKQGEYNSMIGDVFVCDDCNNLFRGYKNLGDRIGMGKFLEQVKGRKGCPQIGSLKR